jgi:hypothetical protein
VRVRALKKALTLNLRLTHSLLEESPPRLPNLRLTNRELNIRLISIKTYITIDSYHSENNIHLKGISGVIYNKRYKENCPKVSRVHERLMDSQQENLKVNSICLLPMLETFLYN